MQLLYLGCEKHHGLAGRVSTADKRHLLALAEFSFDRRGPIGHPGALELGKICDRRPAVAGTGGHHHCLRPHRLSILELKFEQIAGTFDNATTIELRHF
jgi:hypothetical protein